MRLAGEKLPCQRAIGSPLLERVPRWPFFCFNFLTTCASTAVLLLFRVQASALTTATVEAETSLTVWTPSAYTWPHPVVCTTTGLLVKRLEMLGFLRILLLLVASSDRETILFQWLSREGNETLY